MKNTLPFFFSIIFLLTGLQSFAEKKSNDSYACPTASISYANVKFCNSNANIQAVNLTGTDAYLGGVFTSTSGLTINSNTGAITPSTSTSGIYSISYTIPPGPGCPGIVVTTTVEIVEQANAGTDGSTTVCESSWQTINLFNLITGEQAGGTWTSTSGTGGALNAAAGTFTPAMGATTSTFIYSVIGTAPCSYDYSVATINIIHQPNAGTDGGVTICDNSTVINLFDLITGEESGGTWTQTSGTGGTFNAATGTYTPAAGATTSTFTYTLVGAAPCYNDSSVATVIINSMPSGITISGSTSLCSGDSAVLTVTGTPGTVITMTDGSSQNTYTIGASGVINIPVMPTVNTTYTLTSASLNSCTIPVIGQSATVSVSATPQFMTQIPDITICNNSQLNIASQLTSTVPGTTFIWSATTSNVNILTSGDYTNIDQIVNLVNSSQNGTINITVIPQIGNCYGTSQQIVVTVNSIPAIASIVANDTTICNNQFVTITANSTSANSFNWQVNSAAGVQIVGGATSGTSTTGNINLQLVLTNPLVSGTISFNLTPVNGFCTGTTVMNAVTITLNPIPGTPIPLPIEEICSGETTNLTISAFPNMAGTMLEWTVTDSQNVSGFGNGTGASPFSINDVLINTSNVQGFAKYSVKTKFGDCEGGTTEYIVHVNPLPNLLNLTDGEITTDGNGNLVPFVLDTGLDTFNYSFEWYLNDTLIPSANLNTYTATEEGNYSVNVTNLITNCENYATAFIAENLVNNEEPFELIMFTNPLFDTLNFTNNNKVKTIKISNQIGQTVLSKEVNLKNGTIDISILNMGIYNIEFETEVGIVNHRIIKQ